MYNAESVQEKEMHRLLWDFEMLTDLISARQPDLMIINLKREPAE